MMNNMAQQKQICLTDERGQICWFQQDELEAQLAGADMSASGALKALVRNFSKAVREMREAQNSYFKAAFGSPEKQRFLNQSKALERKVDSMAKTIHSTLEMLA